MLSVAYNHLCIEIVGELQAQVERQEKQLKAKQSQIDNMTQKAKDQQSQAESSFRCAS